MTERIFYEMNADQPYHFNFHYSEITKEHPKKRDLFHCHQSLEFVYAAEGTLPVHINGVSWNLNEGEIACVQPGQAHYYTTSDYARIFVLVVSQDFLENPLINGRNLLPHTMCLSEENRKALNAYLTSAYLLWEKTEPASPQTNGCSAITGMGVFYTFYGFLLKSHALPEPEKKRADFPIAEILDYIGIHYAESLDLRTLAAVFNYSEPYFSTRFNDFTNMSLHEYINRIRIFHADKLIGEGMRKSGAAAACGFTSANTFYRAYRDYHEAPLVEFPKKH